MSLEKIAPLPRDVVCYTKQAGRHQGHLAEQAEASWDIKENCECDVFAKVKKKIYRYNTEHNMTKKTSVEFSQQL